MKEKFTVLMSVYKNDNAVAFKEALESVTLQQSIKPNQVVVIYDGPVSAEIEQIHLKIASDNPNIEFTTIKKTLNQGLAAALNTGIKKCKFEWIARMDSDDISTNDRFEKQFSFLNNHPEVDVLGGNIAEFLKVVGDMDSQRIVPTENNEICSMAKTRNPINHPTVIIRRSAIEEVGGYSENFGKLEDYKLWIDLMENKKVFANLPDVVLNFRVGEGFINRRSNRKEIQDWDAMQNYMLSLKRISYCRAIINRIYIRAFIYMPKFLKKIVYKILLRK